MCVWAQRHALRKRLPPDPAITLPLWLQFPHSPLGNISFLPIEGLSVTEPNLIRGHMTQAVLPLSLAIVTGSGEGM